MHGPEIPLHNSSSFFKYTQLASKMPNKNEKSLCQKCKRRGLNLRLPQRYKLRRLPRSHLKLRQIPFHIPFCFRIPKLGPRRPTKHVDASLYHITRRRVCHSSAEMSLRQGTVFAGGREHFGFTFVSPHYL